VVTEITQAQLVRIFSGVPSWILFWSGTTFDPWDILVYFAGIGLAIILDLLLKMKVKIR
jgi:hypothetical protein